MEQEPRLKMYAIYERPEDYPEGYVVRQWLIDGAVMPGDSDRAASLEETRKFIPAGCELVAWPYEPDPKIIEVWM